MAWQGLLAQLGGQRGLLNKEHRGDDFTCQGHQEWEAEQQEKEWAFQGKRGFGESQSLEGGCRDEIVLDLKLGTKAAPPRVGKGIGNKTTLPDNTTGVRSDAADGGGPRRPTIPLARDHPGESGRQSKVEGPDQLPISSIMQPQPDRGAPGVQFGRRWSRVILDN